MFCLVIGIQSQSVSVFPFPRATAFQFDYLNDLEIDKNGVYYTVTSDGELSVFQNGTWDIVDINGDNNADLFDIAISSDGIIWLSSEEGLFSYNNQAIEHYTTENSPLVSNDLGRIAYANNKLWIGFRDNQGDKGFMTLSNGQWEHFTEGNSFLENSQIFEFYELSDGSVLAARTADIYIIQPNGQTQLYDLWDFIDSGSFLRDAFELKDGNIFLATSKGIAKINRTTNEAESLVDIYGDLNYDQLLETPAGEFWISENDNGLYYYKNEDDFLFFDRREFDLPVVYTDMIWNNDSLRVLGDGWNRPLTIALTGPSSTSNVFSKIEIDVFPNPVSDILYISTKLLSVDYEIIDISGQSVLKGSGKEVNVEEMKSGYYIIKVNEKDKASFAQKQFFVK